MEELGTGVLGWNGAERRSDRYGCVALFVSPHSKEAVPLVQVKVGKRGRLIAVVKETRQSHYIGDLFHGVFPQTPQVGQEITLGEGVLFFGNDGTVGVRPDDGRDTLWLDINVLYNVHHQTVTLCFDESQLN